MFKYCALLVQQPNSNMPYIYFYHYKKEKLLASSPIKGIIEKITLHPQKPKNVFYYYYYYWKILYNYIFDFR